MIHTKIRVRKITVVIIALLFLSISKAHAFWPFGNLDSWIEGNWYFKDTDKAVLFKEGNAFLTYGVASVVWAEYQIVDNETLLLEVRSNRERAKILLTVEWPSKNEMVWYHKELNPKQKTKLIFMSFCKTATVKPSSMDKTSAPTEKKLNLIDDAGIFTQDKKSSKSKLGLIGDLSSSEEQSPSLTPKGTVFDELLNQQSPSSLTTMPKTQKEWEAFSVASIYKMSGEELKKFIFNLQTTEIFNKISKEKCDQIINAIAESVDKNNKEVEEWCKGLMEK